MSPLALTKKLDPKTDFGYDFPGFFIFRKTEKLYITTFLSKTLDIPYGDDGKDVAGPGDDSDVDVAGDDGNGEGGGSGDDEDDYEMLEKHEPPPESDLSDLSESDVY